MHAPRPDEPWLRRLAVVAVLPMTLLGACGAVETSTEAVTVTGEVGEPPVLEYDTPLSVRSIVVEVIWEGVGPRVVNGEPILIDYQAEAAVDGSLLNETYSGDPRAYLLTPQSLGLDIYRALTGHRVGSRILQLVPAGEGEPSATAAVFDILPTRADGEAVEPEEGLPEVELADNGAPEITIPDSPPPTDLVVQPLIRGAGEQVAPGQVITVQYTGVTWSDGQVYESTWVPGSLPLPFPIGVGSVLEGWDLGLVEQTVGSQVLLVVPPYLGYGGTEREFAEETLVFVVDILAARGLGGQ